MAKPGEKKRPGTSDRDRLIMAAHGSGMSGASIARASRIPKSTVSVVVNRYASLRERVRDGR